MVQKFF
jgi:transposase InsO family protein